MISTLVEMLGNFYANNDLANVETLARSIHSAVPGDQVSLLFLGLAYYKTGRASAALDTFDKVHATKTPSLLKNEESSLHRPIRQPSSVMKKPPGAARCWHDSGVIWVPPCSNCANLTLPFRLFAAH